MESLESEIISKLEQRGIEHKLVHHSEETRTSREKSASLLQLGANDNKIRRAGVIKSIVFKYQSGAEDRTPHYIVACTSGQRRVNSGELRVELGLSGAEASSLTVDGVALEAVTGKRRGEIGPLIPLEHIDRVYFTGDLMEEAQQSPERLYDLPLSLRESLLVPAAALWRLLQGRSEKYRAASKFTGEINFEIRKPQIQSRPDGPYFGGSILRFHGHDYEIKHPGKSGCVAFPIPAEYDDRGRVRVKLPIGHELLKERLARSFG